MTRLSNILIDVIRMLTFQYHHRDHKPPRRR
jgi:hypothetical protein